VGLKSIAAYRTGLDLDPRRPTEAEVCEAARRWFRRIQSEDAPGAWRVTDPVIIRHGLWTAVDLGLPLQLHTGFGDRDITLHRADPSQLTDWLREVNGQIPVLLLHCWPFHRQAAFLAAVLPNVYFDLGLTMHYVGPARARVIVGEAMEMAPFHKLLYSSDAYGVAEFYYLSAVAFRQGLGEHLQDAVDDGDLSGSDAVRIAAMVGRDNALRVYGLPSRAD
jgi:predicted TIM-barrel fold metal-dependent hydrolase